MPKKVTGSVGSQVSLPDLAELRWTPNISDRSGEVLRTGNVPQQMEIYSVQTVSQKKTGFRISIANVPVGLEIIAQLKA